MLKTIRKSYLYVTLLCLYGFLLSIYFLASGLHLHDGWFSMWKYHGIIPVTLLYLTAILIVRNRNDIILHHISIPSVLFFIFFRILCIHWNNWSLFASIDWCNFYIWWINYFRLYLYKPFFVELDYWVPFKPEYDQKSIIA